MFHLREGFFFGREPDGSVTIKLSVPGFVRTITVPENEWASVVASVCARGENAETWQEARDYHDALP